MTPKYTGLNLQLTMLRNKTVSLGLHFLAIRNGTDEGSMHSHLIITTNSSINLFLSNTAVIHIFDLVPGASRQTEPNSIQTKLQIRQIAVSRAGKQDDQYIVFIDNNRDLFGAEIKNDSEFEMEKIGIF